jgi:hypothetical protein
MAEYLGIDDVSETGKVLGQVRLECCDSVRILEIFDVDLL